MNEASSMPSATLRLERRDASLTSIDLRGKGRGGDRRGGLDDHVPRPKIARLAAALMHHGRPPPSLQPPGHCKLSHLALHNHFLDPCELPLLFDALPYLSTLETLVLFHHDVGDEGVEMLMRALTGGAYGGTVNVEPMALPNANEEGTSIGPQAGAGGLKELYLSHCNISCKGAAAIAKALDHSSSTYSRGSGNKLRRLQVLSLGSNRIEEKGAVSLAEAFGRYPTLQRLVLHCNRGIKEGEELDGTHIYRHALVPSGWQCDLKESAPTNVAMSIFVPLIQPHIQRRWQKDQVLVRPHEELRRRLKEEMYRKDSTFVDSRLERMPDILAWMGREGACCRQTGLHSSSISVRGKCIPHSGGPEYCRACAAVHLNDLHELMFRMPHLIAMFQGMSTQANEEDSVVQDLGSRVMRLAL